MRNCSIKKLPAARPPFVPEARPSSESSAKNATCARRSFSVIDSSAVFRAASLPTARSAAVAMHGANVSAMMTVR
ncbi:MAG: hypothetical protein QM811_20370 [Pirellulales bacterium]